MTSLASSARRDDGLLTRLADWLVVVIAIVLPWSTSATAICIVAWLLVLLPTLDLASIRREVESAAGGLPILLWCLGVVGMLWADVSWTERLHGLGSFHRLLAIPLLLTQFRRSDHAKLVLYGFLASSALAVIATYVLTLTPGLTWRGPRNNGILAHDDIFQGSMVVICGFGALGYAALKVAKRDWQLAFAFTAVAAAFLAYFLVISAFSRSAAVVAFALTLLLGWRLSRYKGLLGACALAVVVGIGSWLTSPALRDRVHHSMDEVREYSATNKATSLGQHVAFLKESLTIIALAPVLGHGTGSIAKEFRQVTAGASGAAGMVTVNPHNQTFAVAIQLGLLGAVVLWSMWIAHLRLFRCNGALAWLGAVIVIDNIISSTVHSHLFDSAHGWLYVFGVGVLGGTALRQRSVSSPAPASITVTQP